MGCLCSKKLRMRVMMVGLDNSGKTSILNRIHKGIRIDTEPTLGFNVEDIQHNEVVLTWWDLGGQEKLRPMWRKYFVLADAIVFVVDSSEPERFPESRDELEKLLAAEDLVGAPLLVYANKMDASGAVESDQVFACLGMHEIRGERPAKAFSSSAYSGQGLVDGLDWLTGALIRRAGDKNPMNNPAQV